MKKNNKKKYFIDRDNSCHWYLVESEYRKQWNKWLSLDEDDRKSWTVPDFAEMIEHPSEIEFEYE